MKKIKVISVLLYYITFIAVCNVFDDENGNKMEMEMDITLIIIIINNMKKKKNKAWKKLVSSYKRFPCER